jgi:hypothetical protein
LSDEKFVGTARADDLSAKATGVSEIGRKSRPEIRPNGLRQQVHYDIITLDA